MVSLEHRTLVRRRHRSLLDLVAAVLRGLRTTTRRGRSARSRSRRVTEPLPAAAAGGAADVAVRSDELGFEVVVIRGEFGARQYREVFGVLQATGGCKVLDLRAAGISSDAFNALAMSWSAPRGWVPRLAIVLDFAHWAVFRNHAEPALAKLAAKGVVAAVIYEEQTRGSGLVSWFSEGPLPRNAPAVVEWLSTRWQPAPIWPVVVAVLDELLQAHAAEEDAPILYTEAASLSLRWGGTEQAMAFAREAVRRAPASCGRVRCRAMRVLADALMRRGQAAEATELLESVIAFATTINEPLEGAVARCQAGLHALRREDFAGAAAHFRGGIALLKFDQLDLQATLHHNLARALSCLGSTEAAHHAARALMLRANKQSAAAESDRMLLASIRAGRIFDN